MNRSSALKHFDATLAHLRTHQLSGEAGSRLNSARTIYLLAPSSFLGMAFSGPIAQHLQAQDCQVVLVDDTLTTAPAGLEGCRLLGTRAFRDERPTHGLAINLANSVFVHRLFAAAAASASIQVLDIVPVLGELGFAVVYQSALAMRDATLTRLGDYRSLAGELADALSLQTLEAFLRLRITLDRDALLPVLCSLEDEYFSLFPTGKDDLSFALRRDETLCDVGAHVGSTVRKFLSATHWQYRAIHAFEPDKGSYAALTQGPFAGLDNFHAHNLALSDKKGVLSFAETGTMGSRLDAEHGNVQVPTSTLDDEVPEASFIKMDVEGHETQILRGARRLISQCTPRMAVTGYHYADDLLDIVTLLREIDPRYRLRLRHHSFYYYDSIVYADVPSE